jgi:hypothetical protein
MLNPSTMLHQKRTLLRSVLPRTQALRWTMTMGICSIMAQKP